jgi:sn-glycerol 3-phosphate transport system substrate-binding protein
VTRRTPIVLLALVVVAAACVRDESGQVSAGGPATSTNLPPCPLDALDRAAGTVEVELWHALAGRSKDNLEALAQAFNRSQPKVRVAVKNEGRAYDEVLRKYNAAIPSRQLPAIAYLEDTSLRELVDSGTLLPAEACERADGSDPGLLPAVRNYYTANEVYWPGYANVSEPVLYFNVNHFERAGLDPADPPETLDELFEVATRLKAARVSERPLALVLNSWFLESWINGAGGEVTNNDNGRRAAPTRSSFDNPVTRRVFSWIKRMNDAGLLDPVSNTDGQIDQYLAVATQKSSMTIETSTAATTIKAFLGGGDVDAVDAGNVDRSAVLPAAAPFPGISAPGRVRVSGGAFYIMNTSPPAVQAAAWRFMRFMQERESQVAWHLVGSYLPMTQPAAADPRVARFWTGDLAGRMLRVAYSQLLEVDPDRPGPQIGPYRAYSDAIENALDTMMFKGASVAVAVSKADAEIDDALRRYAEDNAP